MTMGINVQIPGTPKSKLIVPPQETPAEKLDRELKLLEKAVIDHIKLKSVSGDFINLRHISDLFNLTRLNARKW